MDHRDPSGLSSDEESDGDHEESDHFPSLDPSVENTQQDNDGIHVEYNDDPVFIEKILRERLKRRTDLINEMRRAYLRDILTLKGFLQEHLDHDERKELYEKWKDSIPSIDLRQHLMLYSPHETSLNMLHCEGCGGSIEIVHHESSEIEALSKALSHNDKTKHDLKVVIGTKASQLESLEAKWEVETRKHREEKKVLFREIREAKQKVDELLAELEENRNTLSKFRVENNELVQASKDALETRDMLRQCRLELDRSQIEMRHVEEEMAALQIHRGLEADKLIAMTKNRDHLESLLASALAEKAAEVQENLKIKGNYDAIQKREVRLQGLLDITRKELETLQMTNSELKAELAGIHGSHTQEVENLEKLCDSLREEHDVMSQSLEAAQSHLTKAIQSQEETEAENSRFQQIFETFRIDKGKEIEALKSQLSQNAKVVDECSAKVKVYEENLKHLQSQLTECHDQAEEKEVELKHLRKIEGELKKINQELEKQNEKQKTRINTLERQLAQKREEENKRAIAQSLALGDATLEPEGERKQRKSLRDNALSTGIERDVFEESSLHVDTNISMESFEESVLRPVSLTSPKPSAQRGTPKPSPSNARNTSQTSQIPSSDSSRNGSTTPSSNAAANVPTPSTKYIPRQRGKSFKSTTPSVKSQTGGVISEKKVLASVPVENTETIDPPLEPSPHDVNSTTQEENSTLDAKLEDPPEVTSLEVVEEKELSMTTIEPPSVQPITSPKPQEKFIPKQVKTIKFASPSTPTPTPTAMPVLRRAESDLEREDREEREKEEAIIVSTSYGMQNLPNSKRLQAFSGLKEGEVINLDNPNELIVKSTALLMEKEKHQQHEQRESWIKKYLEYFQENVKKNRRYSLQRKSIQHLSPLEIPLPAPVPHTEEKIVEETSEQEIQKSDSQDSELDWSEESDAIEKEMGVEVAKVWGLLMSGISETLSSRLPEDEIGKLLKCLSPVTIEFAASLAKATMGMWRGMMVAKGTADLLCNVRRLIALTRPHYGFGSSPSQIEAVKGEFKSVSLFSAESHLWRNAYSLDPTVLRAIEKEEREMTSIQHITERRIGGDICFFGDDPKIRPFQYDIALSSLIQMKDYVDSMQMPTQVSLRQLCSDWATTKITSLDADRGDQINELRNMIRRLESECDEKDQKLKAITGEIKRVNEFKERIIDLKKKEKEWKDKAETSIQQNQKLTEEFQDIQASFEQTKSDLQVTMQQVQQQEKKLDEMKTYTASYERDKVKLEAYQEKERIQKERSVEIMIQTDNFGCDMMVQTDFFVPPMTLKHQIRPPSRSGVVGGYPSLTRSSSSSLAGFSTSAASSRPSTSYPVVTPQLDNSSLYSASVSDFTTSHYGAYDHPQPTSPPPYPAYHGHGGGGAQDGSSSAVPSTIFINQKEIDGFEGDASITSSVWSSLEFDEFSEAEIDPLHVSSVSKGFDRTYPVESTRYPGRRDKKRNPRGGASSHRIPSSPASSSAPILSPVRVPSARRTRPVSPGHSTIPFRSPLSSPSPHHHPSSHRVMERGTVDAMSSQSIPSSQSVEEILQAYRQQGRANNHNRKWLQTR